MILRLRMSHLAYPVTALGPGRRLALWVAGCPLRCPDCITPELQPTSAGESIPIARLSARILGLSMHLQGITLTGGEPFAQADALAELWARLAQARPEWNLLVFSGYRLDELRSPGGSSAALLACTDILIDGPYRRTRQIAHPLRASSNQHIHYLSERGRASRVECETQTRQQANLGIGRRDERWLIGIIDRDRRKRLHHELGVAKSVAVG